MSVPLRSGRWLRQPLLWFALVSVALFALHARFGEEEPHTIVVPRDVGLGLGLGPGPERQRWELERAARNEARELGLWRDDAQALGIARERVAELRAGPSREPSDAELAEFLERHRDAFDRPELYAFDQVFVDPRHGEPEVRARAALVALENGAEPTQIGDPFRFPVVFTAEPAARVRAVFGPDFLEALSGARPGTWQTLRSSNGVHLVRLVKKLPARRASVADSRNELRPAYELERASNARREALDAAAREYRFLDEP